MELSENSFVAKYYKWIFHNVLPMDFCTLFWNTLFSIAFFPVIIITRLPLWGNTWYGQTLISRIGWGLLQWASSMVIAVFGLAILHDSWLHWTWVKTMNPILGFFLGLATVIVIILAIVSVVAIVVLLIEGGKWIYYKLDNRTSEKKVKLVQTPAREAHVAIIYNTIRNKYCTKITWKA